MALCLGASSFAADKTPPAPTRWVTDGAGFLSESAREALDARLRAYEAETGHQFIVWIGRSTEGVPIEDFAVRAFKAWGVGQRGRDDGLALFIFSDDRTVRFEVGYGLEGAFPDVAASRIIREVLAPRLQAGDRDGAVAAAVEAATASIARDEGTLGPEGGGGLRPEPSGPRRGGRPLSTAEKVVVGLVVLAFLFILVTNPALALYLLQVVASSGGGSGRGGWGGGGGGGWSGGGGRSGGGGASGSW
jgi:uncharacterized protein